MTGKINPITVTVEFKGQIYLAKITPTINGKDVDPWDSMRKAERINHIYSTRLKAMLQKHEGDYTAEKGLLKEATMQGFACENGTLEHTGKTQELWAQFVESIHTPTPFLSPPTIEEVEEVGPGAKATFTDISAYDTLSSEEKKEVHAWTYLKAVAQGFNKDADFSKEQLHYLKKCGIDPRESHEDEHRAKLLLKLWFADAAEKLSHDEMAEVMKMARAIKEEALKQATTAMTDSE